MNESVEKVQQWLDKFENENIIPVFPPCSSSSTTSTQPSCSAWEGDDGGRHIVAVDSAAAASITIVSSNSDSDDIEMTVSKIDKIWDRTDAMLNQQTFDVAVEEACVRYTCAEVVRMLSLTDDEYYMPSSCFVNHTLRCVVAVFMARFEKRQWRLDMIEKVRNTIASQYKDTYPASSSDGYDEAPMPPADVRDSSDEISVTDID